MSSNAFSRILSWTVDTIFKGFLVTFLRTTFEYLIGFLFVQLPILCHYMITSGKTNDKSEQQTRVRAKLTDESDPLSAYRAVEVLDKLQTQTEHKVKTLAVIPDLCLKRYADKETMGVREILDVEDEKQPNGKVYKKVFYFNFNQNYLFKKKILVYNG
jgi:long-chain acyl-CoA synthetase